MGWVFSDGLEIGRQVRYFSYRKYGIEPASFPSPPSISLVESPPPSISLVESIATGTVTSLDGDKVGFAWVGTACKRWTGKPGDWQKGGSSPGNQLQMTPEGRRDEYCIDVPEEA